MKYIIPFLVLILPNLTYGQSHLIGFEAGVNKTNTFSSNFIDHTNFLSGFTGGITYEYKLTRHFFLNTDLIYSHKGFTNDIIFTDHSGNPNGKKVTTIFNYNYLNIPIKGGYIFGDKFSGFVNIGVNPSLLINSNVVDPKINNVFSGKTTNTTKQVRKFDLGGLIDVGCRYKFRDRFSYFISLSYQQSLTTITREAYFENSSIRHFSFSISTGIKYELK